MDYLDFEVEMRTEGDGSHTVNLLYAPAGEVRQPLVFGWDDSTLRDKLRQLQKGLHFKTTWTSAERKAALDSIQQFGGSLFNALFNDNLKGLYDTSWYMADQQNKGLRLKLRIQSPLLAAIPWELLYDGRFRTFLCTSRQLSVVRYVALPRPVELLATQPPLNILGVVSAPKNLPELNVAQEKQQVEEAIAPLRQKGLATLTWLEQPNWRVLLRAMRSGPWHVLHYVGHSGFDAELEEGFLSLEDRQGQEERLSADKLATLLADHGTLRLVVLNSCKGGQSGQAVDVGSDLYSSTAATLVRRGIPAVIGMQYDISDQAALEFALTFYEVLAENMPVEVALAEARKAISLGINSSVEWGTPVFYTHAPQSVLFDMADVVPVVNTAALDGLTVGMERSLETVDRIDALVTTVWRLAPQLKQQPHPEAYQGLVAALDEVVKTWQATDEAIQQVWQLYRADGDLREAADGLFDITDYQLQAIVAQGRGHCHRINEIYFGVLRDWFGQNGALSEEDRQGLAAVFEGLGTADTDAFWQMERAAERVEVTANEILTLVEDEQLDAARVIAKGMRRELRPLRSAINRSLSDLIRLQGEFKTVAAPTNNDNKGGEVVSLRENMVQTFNIEEIKDMCMALGVDYENLGGEGKSGKVRELILFMERRGRTAALIAYCQQARPHLNWLV